MVMWKGIRVGQARKKFGVEYPDMYSKDSKVRFVDTYFDAVLQGQQDLLKSVFLIRILPVTSTLIGVDWTNISA